MMDVHSDLLLNLSLIQIKLFNSVIEVILIKTK